MRWNILAWLAIIVISSYSAEIREDLAPLLRRHLEETKLPAITAAVVKGSNIVAAGAVGVRKVNTTEKVTLEDKFHIGSCTKSMTALLAVYLARDGLIHLTNKVSSALPNWQLPEWVRNLTLEQLLQNRAGISGKAPPNAWQQAFKRSAANPEDQRKLFLIDALQEAPEPQPGATFVYSNTGYALAGAMIETMAGKSWENLIQEKILRPLGLASAGFGPPAVSEELDEPWGHSWIENEAVVAPQIDNPTAIAPAGAVHMSILDLAKYSALHLAIARGTVPALSTFRGALYEPPQESTYALGWIVEKRDWAGGVVLTHAGSNTHFFSVIWIAPAKDFACMVTTNVGDRKDVVAGKCDGIVANLIQQFVR